MYWIIIVIPFFVNFKRFLVNFFDAVTLWNLCQLLDFCQLFERLLWEPYCSTISYSRWGTLWMVNLFSFRDYFQLFYFFSALWFLSRFGFCQFLDFCQLFQDFFENNIGIQGEGYSGWWTHFHWEFIFHFQLLSTFWFLLSSSFLSTFWFLSTLPRLLWEPYWYWRWGVLCMINPFPLRTYFQLLSTFDFRQLFDFCHLLHFLSTF